MADRHIRSNLLRAAFALTLALALGTFMAGDANDRQHASANAATVGLERIASSPAAATLIGHVRWQGWPPGESQPDPLQVLPFTITFALNDGGGTVNFPFMYTDEYGFFTITTDLLPDGNYNFRFKGHPPDPVNDPGPSWLPRGGNVSIASGQTTRVELGLQLGGDADNSSLTDPGLGTGIDVVDFNILKHTFGKMQGDPGFDARANFVQESVSTPRVIDISDFLLIKSNFGILQP